MTPHTSYVSVTDLFCGAGGSSLGATAAGGEVLLAMNHWQLAIDTHNSNFPHTRHECADASAVNPRRFPTTDVLIASPECTAHTLAKGKKRKGIGQMDLWGSNGLDPSEERSRVTMWDVPRFAEYHRYNLIIVENVVDAALYWAPFEDWLRVMRTLGYEHELVFFNSMFAWPTPQSRDRLYVVFWRAGNTRPNLVFTPPAWCQACDRDIESVQSWRHPSKRRGKYGARAQYVYRCPLCAGVVQPYYYCAANAIDWSMQGKRIGDRKRPLKDKTMERIRYGLEKFGRAPLTARYDGGKIRSLGDPMPTQTTRQVEALVVPPFLMADYTPRGKPWMRETTGPFGSITTADHHELVTPPAPFLASVNYFSDRPRGIDEPLATQTTKQPYALVVPAGGSWNEEATGTDGPLPTQTTREAYGVAVPPAFLLGMTTMPPNFMRDVLGPWGVQTGTRQYGLVRAPFVVNMDIHGGPKSIDEALQTVVAGGNHIGLVDQPAPLGHMLVPYNRTGQAQRVEEPTRTVTTHDREALVSVTPAVEDCTFRMLQPHEIAAAMAFPATYNVLGNQREKVKQFGNAVTPPVMQMLMERCIATLGGTR